MTADATVGPEETGSFEAADQQLPQEVLNKRICDFDLQIEGRPLEKVIARFEKELADVGIREVKPVFYLTDGWGVPEGTVAIGIPFYLANEDLLRAQALHGGMIEGQGEDDILRYLRHEMGHVVNYAYRLYTSDTWAQLFGPMSRPYSEIYKAVPFSPDYVRHLPGSYAQKHPDEDWAETFAIWMTPAFDWRQVYADSPGALHKLEYCARIMSDLAGRPPEVISAELDEPVKEIRKTVQEYYDAGFELGDVKIPKSLDGDLAVIFSHATAQQSNRKGDAAGLLRRHQHLLANSVFRWTGVDPSLIYPVIAHLRARAKSLGLNYPMNLRDDVLVELSGFLTTLAMNFIYRGKFIG